MDEPWTELLLNLGAYLLVGSAGITLAGLALFITPYFWRRPLPIPRLRPGRWGGGEVVLAFLNSLFFAPFAVLALVAFLTIPAVPDAREVEASLRAAAPRLTILGSPLTVALTLAVFTTILFGVSRTRPHQLGVTWARWPANVILGVLAFLVLAPLTLGVYYLTTLVFGAEKHPFELLVAQGLNAWEWALLVFMTVAGAPVVEEFLFRGILQGWLRRASVIGHGVLLTMIFLSGATPLTLALRDEVAHQLNPGALEPPAADAVARAIPPLAFCTVFVAGYVVWLVVLRMRSQGDVGPVDEREEEGSEIHPRPAAAEGAQAWAYARLSIFGSAMFFALLHGWPQSIPLFVLGLGLGWLALRTQSLIGPMVCHALFNAVACLVLAWGG